MKQIRGFSAAGAILLGCLANPAWAAERPVRPGRRYGCAAPGEGGRQDGRIDLTRPSGDAVEVTVGAGTGRGCALLIGYDPRRETPVRRGENAGRTVMQANVVRSLTVLGEWTGRAVALNASAPAGERLAVLLQAPTGEFLGAVR